MNLWLIASAVLSGLTLIAHVVLGWRSVHGHLVGLDSSLTLKALLSVLWHGVTVILAANTVALAASAAAERANSLLVGLVAAQYAGFAMLFVFYGLLRTGSLSVLPQWAVFAGISALALVGLRLQTDAR